MKKQLLLVTLAMTLLLSGCFKKPAEPMDEALKGEGAEVVTTEELEKKETADKTFAEKAWMELSAKERLLVRAEPEVLSFIKDDTPEFQKAFALAEKEKQPLRVVYFKTSDEERNGRLLVYGVGDEFVGKSNRVALPLASLEEMNHQVNSNVTVNQAISKLVSEGQWAEESFSYHVATLTDAPADKPDLLFYQIQGGYYAIPHKEEQIVKDHSANPMWTKEQIEAKFGDVLPTPIS